MSATYRAIEVTRPGQFSDVRRPLQDPGPGQVRIRIEACGVCHSDSATVDGVFPGIVYPRVPGHEVVGRVDALGAGVQGWAAGQRVGIGFLAGFCGYCEFCRSGDLVNCRYQEQTGLIEVPGIELIFGSRNLEGALTGDPATGDDTLRFSVLSGVSAMIETMPLEKAPDAYAKMMSGKARFRMVLTMG